ncbi:MAG TPA: site-2 protease family protein, partial [Candidatus Paceibacterota bacterium]|nr:site-2 protease family protein [Candidatus Paceibacterota bacterium]
MFTLIIFLVILFVLVLVHEFGHFTVAKLFGIRVDEFGIGFPPKLLGKKVGETEYTLNLLPLGGFVRIFGEDPNEKSDDEKEQKRTFYMQPLYAQVLVVIAGVVMNFLLAWVLFFIVFLIGTPSVASSVPKGAAFRDA